MKNVYITSLGKAATFNGGLTNSAIKRIEVLSNEKKDDSFFIHYSSEIEPTEQFVSFFTEKYNLRENVKFLNAHDAVKIEKNINFEDKKYIVDGIEVPYFKYTTDNLQKSINNLEFKKCYLFLDTPFSPDYRLQIKNVEKIFICHNEHIQYKNNRDRHWKTNHYRARGYFQPIQDPEVKVVFLTEQQRADVEKREGNLKKFHTIPHFYTKKENNVIRENKIVVITRLSEEKNVLKILRIYSKMKENIPLEIWGKGPMEQELNSYIEENELENVTLKGFTTRAEEVFSSAKLSISMSKFESFGLSILESLSSGCPVLSSKVNYGPLEMIKDNENGYLIDENASEEETALKIDEYFKKEKYEEFYKKLQKNLEKYQYKSYITKWEELLKQDLKIEQIEKSDKKIITAIDGKNLKVKIPNLIKKYSVRAYDDNLLNYDVYDLKNKVNKINLEALKGKLLTIVIESKSELIELELEIKKINIKQYLFNKVAYKKKIKILYNKNNSSEKFEFIKLVKRKK